MLQRLTAGDIDGSTGNARRTTGDFRVEHPGTGHYRIIFEPRFTKIVSVVATQDTLSPNGSTLDNLAIIHYGDDFCELHTGDSNGNNSNRSFSFIAVGD